MSRESYLKKIEEKINNSEVGEIFVASDFNDIASSDVANKSLFRLSESGVVRRIMRGVYEYPEYSDFLKEYIAPSPDKVAHALARNFGWTIVPSGDTALNLLGLSTQVPAVWLYVSDGTYKEYSFDNVTIKFKRTTNKEISKISYKTALVIQALKALGKEKITDATIEKISTFLSKAEKEAMLIEAKYATSWIYDTIKTICK
ncbi:MAG: DUF6088 family protein [Bacteroidaceae bacterium]|nr:DUF6088 family protein [Bacteroidaceae bacterium]